MIQADLSEVDALLESQGITDEQLAAIADVLRQDAWDQFEQGGIPPWEPLQPATVEAKRRAGYPRPDRTGSPFILQNGAFGPESILIREGHLLSSWTDAGDFDHVETVGAGFVEIGSAVEYAAAHQEGDPERNLPARPIGITDNAMRKAQAIVLGERS